MMYFSMSMEPSVFVRQFSDESLRHLAQAITEEIHRRRMPVELVAKEIIAIQDGRKIEAFTLYRDRMSCGLSEAKRAVERWMVDNDYALATCKKITPVPAGKQYSKGELEHCKSLIEKVADIVG